MCFTTKQKGRKVDMGRASQIGQFNTGDQVKFLTALSGGGSVVCDEVVSKLHKSGRQGVAEIKPSESVPVTGWKKISRKLQHVWKA